MPSGRPKKDTREEKPAEHQTWTPVKADGNDALIAYKPATLNDAFSTLCKAILNDLEEMPDIAHVREIQIRYADGHRTLAWTQIWAVLEGVLGTPIK